jgi:protein-S-isoprenylcysteine O-methyltransferase Ste14
MFWLGLRRSFGRQVTGLFCTGLYRLSRNPQVLGGFLLASGIALLWPSWYALGWVILWMVMFHMMVLSEEEHLSDVYDEEYHQYCEKTPRYVSLRFR